MKPLALIILDGWGLSDKVEGNAVRAANVKNFNFYWNNFPHTSLNASGEAVGLPFGFQGNSEVGHIHLGAGRLVEQIILKVCKTVYDGSFFRNKTLVNASENCKKHNSALHLMGLLSDEGVHATTDHLFSLLEFAKKTGLKKVFVHCFLDGRDVPEKSALKYIKMLQEKIREIGVGRIASIVGRYYAMDRDKNYDRTKRAYDLLVRGTGVKETDPLKAVETAYVRGDKTDYYVQPIVLTENNKPVALIQENDSVVFFNYRSDRARQLTYAFVENGFSEFEVERLKVFFVGMTSYDAKLKMNAVFDQIKITNNLGKVLSKNKVSQLRIAETEKYAHVTFFFNSQVEKPFPLENRILVNSPKVPSYDLKPEMSAYEVRDKMLEAINSKKYKFFVLNFANPDLVGHSGVFEAVVKALEVVDECLWEIVNALLKQDAIVLITGDHGNAEQMLYKNGSICPAHTTNRTPFILVSRDNALKKVKLLEGNLFDVAPTILDLFGIKKSREMTGKSLIEK